MIVYGMWFLNINLIMRTLNKVATANAQFDWLFIDYMKAIGSMLFLHFAHDLSFLRFLDEYLYPSEGK